MSLPLQDDVSVTEPPSVQILVRRFLPRPHTAEQLVKLDQGPQVKRIALSHVAVIVLLQTHLTTRNCN